MDEIRRELVGYMELIPTINTHSHHLLDAGFEGFDLDSLLRNSYVDWCGVPFGNTGVERAVTLEKVRFNSYFIWLEKSLRELYGVEEPLSADNWNHYSDRIKNAHQDPKWHMELLTGRCRYEKIILDTYWQPGSNNGYPSVFSPAFRINMFLFGYNMEARDHGGNNAQRIYGTAIHEVDEYVAFMREAITLKKQQGCVALKSAIAYDRGLDFEKVSKESAQKAFGRTGYAVTEKDIKAFQDYIFSRICEIAAELELPFQCHTGMGILEGTRAMQMSPIIRKNPNTKFVLFHCGYPWIDDICGLTHVYPNVYPDLCWLPLLSTSAAERMLHELIEVGTADKVCWGCDTWTSEESYGALLAIRHVLAKVLTDKISEGYLQLDDAKIIIRNILFHNAEKLYRIG